MVHPIIRRREIMVFPYLDDWLLLADSEALQTTQLVIQLLEELGWIANRDKSSLVPSQLITYLGATIDLRSGLIALTVELNQVTKVLAISVSKMSALQAREPLRLLGLMVSLTDVLPYCHLFMRPVQAHLSRFYKPSMPHLYNEGPSNTRCPSPHPMVDAVSGPAWQYGGPLDKP